MSRLVVSSEARWLTLYMGARLAGSAFAAALVLWGGMSAAELLLLLYGPLSTAVLAASPRIRRMPTAWTSDFAATLACVLASGDWRSPFYLLWLSSLCLPAVTLARRRAAWLAIGAPIGFLVIAFIGGPAWNSLRVSSAETLAIHLSLPPLLVLSLNYAADAVRRLASERAERERLAIEAERRWIAWELHDSAKQRVHAAHLLVSSLQRRVPDDLEVAVEQAAIELAAAASDMDTSLGELRSPLEDRPLDEALRSRASELAPQGEPIIRVRGRAPSLPPLVAAHVYRIASEAITNALRHAGANTIDVAIDASNGCLHLRVSDDGRGLAPEGRSGGTGLLAMENRAVTIGGSLEIADAADGPGTVITLHAPITEGGGG